MDPTHVPSSDSTLNYALPETSLAWPWVKMWPEERRCYSNTRIPLYTFTVWINAYSEHSQVKGLVLHCALCQEDDMMDAEAKAAIWEHYKLTRHMKSNIHSPLEHFKRLQWAAQKENNGLIPCPYCDKLAEAADEAVPTFSQMKYLMQHLENSDDQKLFFPHRQGREFGAEEGRAADHDALKKLEDWYEANWTGNPMHHEKLRQSNEQKKRKIIESYINYAQTEELDEPVPVPGCPLMHHAPSPQVLDRAIQADIDRGLTQPADPNDTSLTAQLLATNAEGIFTLGLGSGPDPRMQESVDQGLVRPVPLNELPVCTRRL